VESFINKLFIWLFKKYRVTKCKDSLSHNMKLHTSCHYSYYVVLPSILPSPHGAHT
jgi:hypothetical protein